MCGETDDLHIHHIVYRSHSGDDIEANCCCLCVDCHTKIHARNHETWAELATYVETERPDVIVYLTDKLEGRALFYLGGCKP